MDEMDEDDTQSFYPLEEDHIFKDPLCETHHLGGSLKESEENIIAAKDIIFVDANALVLECLLRYSRRELEGEAFFMDLENLNEQIDNVNEIYMNPL